MTDQIKTQCLCADPFHFHLLPLPLGEGWGEGLAENKTHHRSLFVGCAEEEEKGLELRRCVGPHPSPLPKGEGIFIRDIRMINDPVATPRGSVTDSASSC